jgi:hypothetical protein
VLPLFGARFSKRTRTEMKFVISTTALLVLGSIIGSLAGLLFWPDLSYATGAASRANVFLHTHHHPRRMG